MKNTDDMKKKEQEDFKCEVGKKMWRYAKLKIQKNIQLNIMAKGKQTEGKGLSQSVQLSAESQRTTSWLEVDNYLIISVSSRAIATTENPKVMSFVLFLAMWGV